MEKAMSVAIGIAHPISPGVPRFRAKKMVRRKEHAPRGGDGRQERLAKLAELALDELTLDLHPDDEEEDGHQPVVDHLTQAGLEPQAPEAQLDRRRPQPLEFSVPGRVRQRERQQRGPEQHDAARRLQPGERAEGSRTMDRNSGGAGRWAGSAMTSPPYRATHHPEHPPVARAPAHAPVTLSAC
jgi:hypothetical protein